MFSMISLTPLVHLLLLSSRALIHTSALANRLILSARSLTTQVLVQKRSGRSKDNTWLCKHINVSPLHPPFLTNRPGFEYIEGGEQGTGYYNLGRAKALTSLTAASAAKAARNAITPAPAPMPAQPASTLSVQSLGQQRSASESHLLPPPQPATVATTLPPGELVHKILHEEPGCAGGCLCTG